MCAIDSKSCILYNLLHCTNTVITNTSFLLDLHKILLLKSKETGKKYIVLQDNSDLNMNLFTISVLDILDKDYSKELGIESGRIK